MDDKQYLHELEQELYHYEMAGAFPPEWLVPEIDRLIGMIYGISIDVPEPEWESFDAVMRDMSCKHTNTIEDWYGSRWFAGEVYDNHYSVLRCADCGLILSGEEEYGENF